MHIVLCVGARADIKTNKGETALQMAEDGRFPEKSQDYAEVHEDVHSIKLGYTANGC